MHGHCYVMVNETKGLSFILSLNPFHFLEDLQVEHALHTLYICSVPGVERANMQLRYLWHGIFAVYIASYIPAPLVFQQKMNNLFIFFFHIS